MSRISAGELGVASMVAAIVGAIWIVAHVPGRPSLAVSVVVLALSAAFLVAAVALLAQLRAFAWRTFFAVWRWALVAYVVIAGMIEYVFVYDHTPTRQLVPLTLVLALFAIDVPLILAFGVARYQQPDSA